MFKKSAKIRFYTMIYHYILFLLNSRTGQIHTNWTLFVAAPTDHNLTIKTFIVFVHTFIVTKRFTITIPSAD
jgi:hypothetical protein